MKILNKHYDEIPEDAVYIGRGSKWGNPYSHLEGTTAEYVVDSREEAVRLYEEYVRSNQELYLSLPELVGKDLVCYCSPNLCHGEVLRKLALSLGRRGWDRYPSKNPLLLRNTHQGRIDKSFSEVPNYILVFGSNTEGRHGKGVAKLALDHFGAVYGQSSGLQGRSYAIITKDLTKSVHPSIEWGVIRSQILELYEFARNHTEFKFLIPYTNEENLNHYEPIDMARAFYSENIPTNISFNEDFLELINSVYIENHYYEVSTLGDKRFSALNAILSDGRSLEEAYQLDLKGFRFKIPTWTKIYLPSIEFFSGGANGSDTYWDDIAEEFGIKNRKHYYIDNSTPRGNYDLRDRHDSDEVHAGEVFMEMTLIAKNIMRTFPTNSDYVNNLLLRNWYIIQDSDAIYAVGRFLDKDKGLVKGGTGWGVYQACSYDKLVYFYDLDTEEWYMNGERDLKFKFHQLSGSPWIIEERVGFIGTREVDADYIKPIMRKVFELTIKHGGEINTDWREGKGKDPINKKYVKEWVVDRTLLYKDYCDLWYRWIMENPHLLVELAMKSNGKILTDRFASTEINQARALTDIMNNLEI